MSAKPQVRPVLSPSDRLKRSTNYEQGKGFAPLYHAMLVDCIRLKSGESCLAFMLQINAHQERFAPQGEGKAKKYPDAGWTPFLTLEDWANLSGCDVRTIQRERDYLTSRKIAESAQDVNRRFSFRLRYREWEHLEDYSVWLDAQKKPQEEPEEEQGPDDPAQPEVKPGNVRLVKAPLRVAKGKQSKTIKVNVGIKSIHLDNRLPVDVAFDLVVKSGDLWITPAATLAEQKPSKSRNTSKENKHLNPIADDTGVVGTVQYKSHPRGKKIGKVFDEFIALGGGRLLSPDEKTLFEVCTKLGDTPDDYVIKFVSERAGRGKISGPRACLGIAGECKANWMMEKNGPPKGVAPLSAKKKGFVEGVIDEARKRYEKYGRI